MFVCVCTPEFMLPVGDCVSTHYPTADMYKCVIFVSIWIHFDRDKLVKTIDEQLVRQKAIGLVYRAYILLMM